MRDIGAPLTITDARRWAARPARRCSPLRAPGALLAVTPGLLFLGIALFVDALLPGETYPQQTGVTGWFVHINKDAR